MIVQAKKTLSSELASATYKLWILERKMSVFISSAIKCIVNFRSPH